MIRLSKRYRNLMTHKVEETSVIFVFEFDRAKTGEYLKQLLIVSNRSVASWPQLFDQISRRVSFRLGNRSLASMNNVQKHRYYINTFQEKLRCWNYVSKNLFLTDRVLYIYTYTRILLLRTNLVRVSRGFSRGRMQST